MPNDFRIISQTVDTIKTHYTISPSISDEDFQRYTDITKNLTSLKKQAQETRNNYGSTKSINHHFGDFKFNILPTSITGFSIVMQNSDFSIALKQAKNKVNGSPLVKVEFRAEFLARLGYVKCLNVVNQFVKDNILSEYKVDVSEIHLATDVQGYDFKLADFMRMKTRMRSGNTHDEVSLDASGSMYGTVTTFTGLVFGKGDYMLRVYNKSKEIEKFKAKSFAKVHLWDGKPNYNPDKTVWRLEIQIRRAKLKKMVNSDGSSMDDYQNCLNGIPDLWAKAMSDYEIKDVSRKDVTNLLYMERELKDGTLKPLSKHAVSKIFARANSLYFWEDLKQWNHHSPKLLNTAPKIPKRGSQEYVNNSIKSLYSTLAKHKGSVTKETLIEAFKEANEDNIEKKEVSLLEDSFNKQLDWMDLIDEHVSSGVCNTPDYKDLEHEIVNVVIEADEHIKSVYYSEDIVKRIEKRLSHYSPVSSVHKQDRNYLQNLLDRLDAEIAFPKAA